VLLLLWLTLPFNLLIYGVNDVFDQETDAKSTPGNILSHGASVAGVRRERSSTGRSGLYGGAGHSTAPATPPVNDPGCGGLERRCTAVLGGAMFSTARLLRFLRE
jgi:hypothetical protein